MSVYKCLDGNLGETVLLFSRVQKIVLKKMVCPARNRNKTYLIVIKLAHI